MLGSTARALALAASLGLALPAALVASAPAALADQGWVQRVLAEGLLWRSRAYDSLFHGPQRVHVIEFRRGAPGLEVRAVVPPGGAATARVSAMGRSAGALAAVNGGYFGGGYNYSLVKSRGRIVARNVYPRTSFGVTATGRYVMRQVASADPFAEAVEAVGGGPRLVTAGRIDVRYHEERFDGGSGIGIFTPAPRTAVGVTGAGNLLLVTIDGRRRDARGMTLADLAQYMVWLGARDAVNLDGGGSTACYVGGRGTVNGPSDGAERAVGAALAVVRRR